MLWFLQGAAQRVEGLETRAQPLPPHSLCFLAQHGSGLGGVPPGSPQAGHPEAQASGLIPEGRQEAVPMSVTPKSR